MSRMVRVLVVDDSAMARKVLTRGLGEDPSIRVIGEAADAYDARDKIVALRPDVMTLDVEMPHMDGVEFLRRLMPQYPIPVVMVSALTHRSRRVTLEALEAGAVDFVTKPDPNMSIGLDGMLMELRTKVKIASTANVAHWKHRRPSPRTPRQDGPAYGPSRSHPPRVSGRGERIVAIGGSTGGPEAVRTVINSLPTTTPGILVVLHMPPGFTALFASGLNESANLEVREAVDGDLVLPGLALVAPGNKHMRVMRGPDACRVRISDGEPVSGHRPSVDAMMQSVAEQCGANAIGVLLSGMGRDGALGMEAIHGAGHVPKALAVVLQGCVASALIGQNGWISDRRVSGSS